MRNWKFTIPVIRAEERSDGSFLFGEASGPERDTHGTEMSQEAIIDFARQVRDRVEQGDPLPYIDAHAKDGVLRQLGHIVEASLTPDFHLKVGILVDRENPAADFHFKQLQRGKQMGLSISGNSTEWKRITDPATGRSFIRFMKVVLSEISATSRPSWTPSFGTVLARSIDGEEGEPMADNLDGAAPVETTEPEADAAITVPAAPEQTSDEAPDAPVTEPERSEEPVVEDVERARIAAADKRKVATALQQALTALAELGIEPLVADTTTPEAPEAAAAPAAVENSDTGDDTVEFNGIRIDRALAVEIENVVARKVADATVELTRQIEARDADIATKTEQIEQLMALPAGKVPPSLARNKFEGDQVDLTGMTPEEAFRAALTARYGNL
jgi:hypothetical protein